MILDRLRDETKSLHEELEDAVNLPARLVARSCYAGLLGRFYGFFQPLEEKLGNTHTAQQLGGLELQERRRAHLLRKDLSRLGRTDEEIDRLPLCHRLPEVDTAARAFGCLYVLEGSTLGGQYVSREAERHLGLTPADGVAFFSGSGERTGAMWKAFCRALEQFSEDSPESASEVIFAARTTFQGMRSWISEELP